MTRLLITLALLAAASVVRANEKPVTIDQSHSHIVFNVKVPMNAFKAELTDYHLDVLADADNGKIVSAQFSFKFAGIKTGDPRCDREMIVWENEDQFPQVLFTLVSLDPLSTTKYQAHGQLVFHGVKKDIDFPVTVTVAASNDQAYTIDGDYALDTREFNLPVARRYFVLSVDPIVNVTFHLQGSVAKP